MKLAARQPAVPQPLYITRLEGPKAPQDDPPGRHNDLRLLIRVGSRAPQHIACQRLPAFPQREMGECAPSSGAADKRPVEQPFNLGLIAHSPVEMDTLRGGLAVEQFTSHE